jgi:preprotein translocase subunit SecG
MQTVLIVVHLLIVIALVGVVLLQRSEGGALGIGGGGFMTGRGQANALSRATAILGALFFATSLVMSIIAGWSRAPRSIIDNTAPASTSQPAGKTTPAAPGNLLDQLKKMDNSSSAPAPAPAEPAPAAPAQEPPK